MKAHLPTIQVTSKQFDSQRACGLATSPGVNTTKTAKGFDTIRLRTAKRRNSEKYQDNKRKKSIAMMREEERRVAK